MYFPALFLVHIEDDLFGCPALFSSHGGKFRKMNEKSLSFANFRSSVTQYAQFTP